MYRTDNCLMHCLFHSVPTSGRHLTDTSPTACLQTTNDNLKLERKRRQRQKQEEFLQQLIQKQTTNSKDLQIKLLLEKNASRLYITGTSQCKGQIGKCFLSRGSEKLSSKFLYIKRMHMNKLSNIALYSETECIRWHEHVCMIECKVFK